MCQSHVTRHPTQSSWGYFWIACAAWASREVDGLRSLAVPREARGGLVELLIADI